MGRRITLRTDLSPDEARARLRQAVDPLFSPFGRRPVRGRIADYVVVLCRRRVFHAPLTLRLGLVLEPQDERFSTGLILHGRFYFAPMGRMLTMGTGLVLAGVFGSMIGALGAASPVPWLVGLGGGLALAAVVWLGMRLDDGSDEVLVEFLKTTLEAHVFETPRES